MAEKKLGLARKLQLTHKSYKKLAEPTLRHRKAMFKALAAGYFDSGTSLYHTVNLIGRGVDSVVPFLVEGNPRFKVGTKIKNYRPWAHITQLAINYYLEKIKLAEKVLIPAALSSMFGAGITRTVLTHSGNIRMEEGGVIRPGVPSVSLIDDANYVGDPAATRRDDFTLEGDVYRLPTAYARDFFARRDEFGNQIADYIKPDGKIIQDYTVEELTKTEFDRAKLGITDYTTFIDFYLYDENVIVTIMPEGKKAKILRTVEWKGPEGGPYDYLGYKFLPGFTVPLPPAWSWHDLDVTMNRMFDKAREQAENQKKVLAYEGSAEADAKRIVRTPNMGSVRVDNIAALKEIDFGGINDANLAWMALAEGEFTKQGGNPDVLGGRGAQAPTLGQEQMVFSNATRIVRNMSTRFNSFVTSIVRKFVFDFWNNPQMYVPVLRDIPGYGQLPAVFSDQNKVGDFQDFVYDLVPFSMQRENPELTYSKMMQFMTSWVLPTMQIAAMQGMEMDIPTVTKIMAEYAGFDEFNQMYRSAVPQQLDNVPYTMTTASQRPNPKTKTGQTSDAFGATDVSRTANKQQQQTRTASDTAAV